MFRINSQSVHFVYIKGFYGLLETEKNCYYRMLNRASMVWRPLLLRMSTRYQAILKKRVDSRWKESVVFFDHVKGCCVLGYKLLLLAYFDGCSTIPVDFSIHCEKGNKKDYGLTDLQRKEMYSKKRSEEHPDKARFKECDSGYSSLNTVGIRSGTY